MHATEDASATTTTSPIEALFPGYFAMVMATGIVAVAAFQQDLEFAAQALYVVAAAAYIVLSVLLIARVILYWDAFAADVVQHVKGFAFLTTVATEAAGAQMYYI